ncbi:MAG: tellurite resistance TerB family protein [Geminicoccaceae bacterium]|nr:tellurite resistance TerB family protein [Geminicoccaceae bacterium]
MADLQRLLGGLLASGMGGRSRRGPSFAASPFLGSSRRSGMGSFRKTAGLGALAYLGYKAYQEYQKNSQAGAGTAPGGGTRPGAAGGTPAGQASGGPSLGERLGSLLGGSSAQEPEPEPATLDDAHALLLIRAMVAAANADGEISPDERQAIAGRLDQAGAGPEEKAVLQEEMQNPRSVDQIAREVKDQETAEEVYLASRLAMDPDTAAEKAYLDYLASRLNIPSDRVNELNAAA